MACLLYRTRHIGSCVSVHCRSDVRLLQRRPAPHIQKCAIATRQNGDIFNPEFGESCAAWQSLIMHPTVCMAVIRTAGVTSGGASRRGGPDQAKPALKVARLSENATLPTKASDKAAGYDLFSAYDYTIAPMEKAVVNTDIQIAVPSGCYGRVAPRSGLAVNHFIDVGAGVVDEDYRGNVGVVLFNFSKETFQVRKGDRVAQLICERICHPELEQCEALDETKRGSDGFGSTGRS